MMKRIKTLLLVAMFTLSLAGCGGGEGYALPVQHWKGVDIRVETHPNPPQAGMAEIVVIITGLHGRPIPDISVSLRGNDSLQWVQAIQDGMIGVYRRAINIGEGKEVGLQVRLQNQGEEKILIYPLKLVAG